MISSYGLRDIFVWLFLLSGACQSPKISPLASSTAGAAPASTNIMSDSKRCEDRSVCTREYQPALCDYEGQQFSAANSCEARRQARRLACDHGQPFLEGRLRCKSNHESHRGPLDCAERAMCTREYMPHQCSFDGKFFKGPNLCEALVQVKLFACKNALKFAEESVACVKIHDLEASP